MMTICLGNRMKSTDKLNAQRIFRENVEYSRKGNYYTVDTIDEMLDKALKYVEYRTKKSGRGDRPQVLNLPCAFDTETTSMKIDGKKYAWVYCWIYGINGLVVIARSPEERDRIMAKIAKRLDLGQNRCIPFYVHNLGYDFQFERSRMEITDYFARKKSAPMYVQTVDGFQFRDSLCLTGYKLSTTAENLTEFPEIKKMIGDLNYEKIRHYKTKLSNEEMQYCINDVLVVMCDIYTRMKDEGWNISKIPMTKTGYVRRVVREACLYGRIPGEPLPDMQERNEAWKAYKKQVAPLTLYVEEFILAKEAFAGGHTHGSPYYIMVTILNVASYDFTSSYPACMVAFTYPMSKGRKIKVKTKDELEAYCRVKCCLFTITLYNLESVFDGDSYLSKSKCNNAVDVQEHNGRVYSAKRVTIKITDVDWQCVKRCYNFTGYKIGTFFCYERGYLPTPYVKTILYFYQKKTELKNVKGREKEYQYYKELLNSLYGMMVTDIESDEICYENTLKDSWSSHKPDIAKTLGKYNESKTRFLSYLWGVWVTAYARRNLWTAIFNIGYDYIYSDTDSVKVRNHEKYKEYFEKYNTWITDKLEKACEYHGVDKSLIRPKTIEGIEKPLGVWDFEGTYTRFKTLGAKRYIYTSVDKDKETGKKEERLHITISGVDKDKGAEYLMKKYETFDNVFDHFDDDLEFPSEYTFNEGTEEETTIDGCGKLTHTYINEPFEIEVEDYQGNKCIVSEKTFCHLEKTSYTLSMIDDFINFCLNIRTEKAGI